MAGATHSRPIAVALFPPEVARAIAQAAAAAQLVARQLAPQIAKAQRLARQFEQTHGPTLRMLAEHHQRLGIVVATGLSELLANELRPGKPYTPAPQSARPTVSHKPMLNATESRWAARCGQSVRRTAVAFYGRVQRPCRAMKRWRPNSFPRIPLMRSAEILLLSACYVDVIWSLVKKANGTE